jgi:hypothetical protein
MSLSIGSSLPSLYTQQILSSNSSQSSTGSSVSNMEDTYTPSLASQSSTETLTHQMKNALQVQVDTAVASQKDATISSVMAMFGI